jgi:chitin synthase
MYQYNNPNNNNGSPLPSARLPNRPRFNTGEEYSMQQTSFNGNKSPGGGNAGSPGGYSPQGDDLGYYESNIPGSNSSMQRPLLGKNANGSSISTATTIGGGGTRFGAPPSNMIGGGPGDFGIAPRRQTRRYKTGKRQ